MTSESTLVSEGTSIVKGDVTEDVSEAIVPDNQVSADKYQGWLDDAAKVCGSEMKGDIDPVRKQAENLAPVADDLASQLGLEDVSGVAAMVAEEEEAELNKMDEDSRQFDFTAEDVGICPTEGSYSPALEAHWSNIERCLHNVERLRMHDQDAQDLILSIESAGVIDQDTAMKLRDRLPGSLDNVNVKMFTKLPSTVGYNLAREGSLTAKIIIGGLIILGSIFLIYKILTWTIDGIKIIAKIVKRIRERRQNLNRTVTRVGNETFDPETMDVEKTAKALFNDPTVEVKAKLKSAGRQPLELRNIKWTCTQDFAHLVTPLLIRHLDDIDGFEIGKVNSHMEQLVEDVHGAINGTQAIMDEVIASPGANLNDVTTAQRLNDLVNFASKYVQEFNIPPAFANTSNVERLRGVYEWLDDSIKPALPTTLRSAPTNKFINSLGDVHFDLLNEEFATQITTIRETLNPKGKDIKVEEDTLEQAELRKEIIKDISVTFIALSNMIRSIYHYTLYIENVIIAEDQFINKVKKITS